MSVTISFPALLSDRIDGVGQVNVEGDTVQRLLRSLTATYPQLAPLIWHGDGTLNPVLVVFLNGGQVAADALHTPVSGGDEVVLVPAIEGGEPRLGRGRQSPVPNHG